MWHPILEINAREVSEAVEGKIYKVKVNGRKLAVSFTQGQWRAFDTKCPHANGSLHEGTINKKGEVVCPLHRFAFDLKTGKCDSGGYFINTYPCKVEKFEIQVDLPKKKFLGLF